MDKQEKIIQLLFCRSEQAISEMFRVYGGLCREVASRFLSSREDVDEILNDTMLVAWNKIPPEKPEFLGAYLSKITRNLAMTKLRSNTAALRDHRLTQSLSELESVAGSGEMANTVVDALLLTKTMDSFLSKQSKLDRYIFVRRYYYMDTSREIGLAIHLSPSAVRKRLTLMRAQLRAMLEKEGIVHE